MQVLFYYNPRDHYNNQGINLSSEYNFYIVCTQDESGYNYVLYNCSENCRKDIFSDDKFVSVTAIVGENGSGKTTLLRHLMGEYDDSVFDAIDPNRDGEQFVIIIKEYRGKGEDYILTVYYKIEDGSFRSKIGEVHCPTIDLSDKLINRSNRKSVSIQGIYKDTSVIYFTSSYYEKWASSIFTVGKIQKFLISPEAENMLADRYFNNIIFMEDTVIHEENEVYYWKQKLKRNNVSQGFQRILDLLYYKRMNDRKIDKNRISVFQRLPEGFKITFVSVSMVLGDKNSDFLNYKAENNPWKIEKPRVGQTREQFYMERLYWNGNILGKMYSELSEEDKVSRFLYYNLLFEYCVEKKEEIPATIQSVDSARDYIKNDVYKKQVRNSVDVIYYEEALREIDKLVSIVAICERPMNKYSPDNLAYDRSIIIRRNTEAYKEFLDFISDIFQRKEIFVIKYFRLVQDRISSGQRCIQNLSSWICLLPEIQMITGNKISVLCDNIILIVDEIDLYLHPDWQINIIKELLNELRNVFQEENTRIQLIFSTHSPLCLSDIPVENTVYLYYEKLACRIRDRREIEQTFGREIYHIFKDSFFLSNTMGGFATDYINDVLKTISELHIEVREYIHSDEKREENRDKNGKYVNENDRISLYNNRLEEVKIKSEVIGNKAIRDHIKLMMNWISEDIKRIGTV